MFATVIYRDISWNPLVVFFGLNAIAVLLYLGFEKPMNIWLRKKLLKKDIPHN
jgi:hypothetical protein